MPRLGWGNCVCLTVLWWAGDTSILHRTLSPTSCPGKFLLWPEVSPSPFAIHLAPFFFCGEVSECSPGHTASVRAPALSLCTFVLRTWPSPVSLRQSVTLVLHQRAAVETSPPLSMVREWVLEAEGAGGFRGWMWTPGKDSCFLDQWLTSGKGPELALPHGSHACSCSKQWSFYSVFTEDCGCKGGNYFSFLSLPFLPSSDHEERL